jgi:hypothetical protein
MSPGKPVLPIVTHNDRFCNIKLLLFWKKKEKKRERGKKHETVKREKMCIKNIEREQTCQQLQHRKKTNKNMNDAYGCWWQWKRKQPSSIYIFIIFIHSFINIECCVIHPYRAYTIYGDQVATFCIESIKMNECLTLSHASRCCYGPHISARPALQPTAYIECYPMW